MSSIALCLSDLHYPYHDPKYISIATKLIKQLAPDHVIQHGDALDASSISKYLKLVGHESKLIDEINLYNDQLDKWQKLLKRGATFHCCEGNHSARLQKYIASQAKEINDLIKSIPEMLRIKERKNFIWHPYNNWKSCKIGDVYFFHGTHHRIGLTKRNIEIYKAKTVQGHSHRYEFTVKGNLWAACIGHGSLEHKTNHVNAPSDWQQAMCVVTFINGIGHYEPILINNGRAVFRGKEVKA